MRAARLTFTSAWHHVMNRGHNDAQIFRTAGQRVRFVCLLGEACRKYRMRLVAYCVMSTHYHLVLQNSSGKLSEFMKWLNAAWARIYHQKNGGKGYVFQGRFKSTVVQDNEYLETVICYVLLNPVRAGLADNPWAYPDSSIHSYYGRGNGIVDAGFVKELFPGKSDLSKALSFWNGKAVEIISTRAGPVAGTSLFSEEFLKRFERRKTERTQSGQRRRLFEGSFKTSEAVIRSIEKEEGCRLSGMEFRTYREKNVRSRLLVRLKDECGMSYPEIVLLPMFGDLKQGSLGSIYANAKGRMAEE